MKKFICILFAVVMVLTSAVLTGCDGDKKDNDETKATATTAETEDTTAKKTSADSPIKKYLDSFVEGDNDFYGAWQLDGFSYMNIIFRNDNLAELVTGTEGYFSKCTVDTKKKTVSVQLMPGVIDGVYNYDFSKDKQKLTLTLDDNSLVLVKQKDFSLMPKAPKNPKLDKDLLGWWENEDGMFYCFQDDGIMYENSISMETCYTYSVSNVKIKAVYTSGSEMDDDFEYSLKDGKLTLNGSKCTRKEMD